MKNEDKPAAPFQEVTSMVGGVPTGYRNHKGLTKREMFAMHAMQALATNSGYGAWEDMASDAVNIADALLAELEHTK